MITTFPIFLLLFTYGLFHYKPIFRRCTQKEKKFSICANMRFFAMIIADIYIGYPLLG